ncbi:MAG TPA: hypothetical protein VFL13_10055 [Candidatus Baltobacteraceae bacterium]|nr:hypothetical protein [Candidatus Baltobacteraceae bacterium]
MFSNLWFAGDSLYAVDGGSFAQMRLRRFDKNTGALLANVKHSRNVRDVLLKDGELVVLCDRGIDIYDNDSLELRTRWDRHRLPVYANHVLPLGASFAIANVDALTVFHPGSGKRSRWKFDDAICVAGNGASVLIATVGGKIFYLADAGSKLEQTGETRCVDHIAVDDSGYLVFSTTLRRGRVLAENVSKLETPLADVDVCRFSFDGKHIDTTPLGATFWLKDSCYSPQRRLLFVREVNANPELRFSYKVLDTSARQWRGTIDVPAGYFARCIDSSGSLLALERPRDDGREIVVARLLEP